MPPLRRRILIVDDDESTVEVLKRFLVTKGFDTTEAKDGQSGIDLARRFRPDLILLDIMMPDLSGDVVCKALKEDRATSSIPVIMTTAKREREDLINGLDVGADDYVRKPFDVYELLARIKAHLRVRDLYDDMEASHVATLLEFVRGISGATTARQLLDAALERFGRIFDLAHAALVLVEPDAPTRGIVTAATADGPVGPGEVELSALPEVARAVATREVQVETDGDASRHGLTAVVTLPVTHGELTPAAFRLRTASDRGLGRADLRLARLLAGAAAPTLRAILAGGGPGRDEPDGRRRPAAEGVPHRPR